MTLEEAIVHAEDTAKSAIGCECREEHRQLAEWLRELQETRKERDYWQEKAHSYEQTIFKLTDAISKLPEIIHCGECRFREIRGVDGFCDHITGEPIMVKKTDYCSWGEKEHVENG